MRLDYNCITSNLQEVFDRMKSDRLGIGLVGYIGSCPKEVGEFFAKQFSCELIHLPSIQRKGKNRALARIANQIYPVFPEQLLKLLSEYYMKMYSLSERIEPEKNVLENISQEDDSPVLLTDDNVLTGETLETWKRQIQERSARKIYTFTIAVMKDYHPDYYCFDRWCSFAWRPIGV